MKNIRYLEAGRMAILTIADDIHKIRLGDVDRLYSLCEEINDNLPGFLAYFRNEIGKTRPEIKQAMADYEAAIMQEKYFQEGIEQ